MNDLKIHKAPHRWPLVLIALDKLVKATGLTFVSFVLAPHYYEPLKAWLDQLQLGPHNWLVSQTLHSLTAALGYSPRTLHLFRICVLLYAGLYLIEGLGLIFEKKWGEWLVVISTAASLPLEIIGFIRKPSWGVAELFLLNLLMAAYLVWRLRRQSVIEREKAQLAPTSREGL